MLPFSVFQFENKKDQVWGISFNRHIHKTQEEVIWPGHRKSSVGTVSTFGVLLGIKNIPEPKKIELTPYVLSSFNDTATTEIYTLSLHDALPI